MLTVAPVPARMEAMITVRGAAGLVRLDVYDVHGSRVDSRLVDSSRGFATVGSDLASGAYLVKARDLRGVSRAVPMIIVR